MTCLLTPNGRANSVCLRNALGDAQFDDEWNDLVEPLQRRNDERSRLQLIVLAEWSSRSRMAAARLPERVALASYHYENSLTGRF